VAAISHDGTKIGDPSNSPESCGAVAAVAAESAARVEYLRPSEAACAAVSGRGSEIAGETLPVRAELSRNAVPAKTVWSKPADLNGKFVGAPFAEREQMTDGWK
jgi:hypothetical protein